MFSSLFAILEEREPIGSYNVDGRRRQSQQLEKDFQATNQI